jgi:membrane metallo-endopeptidase-like protein 1
LLSFQLELSPDNFMGNILNITKSATRFALSKLRKPIIPDDWITIGKPAVINAFYNPMHNSIRKLLNLS